MYPEAQYLLHPISPTRLLQIPEDRRVSSRQEITPLLRISSTDADDNDMEAENDSVFPLSHLELLANRSHSTQSSTIDSEEDRQQLSRYK